jgi:hypothetical protein
MIDELSRAVADALSLAVVTSFEPCRDDRDAAYSGRIR